MEILFYIVIGLVVLTLLAKIFGAVHSAAENRRYKRNRKRYEKAERRIKRKREAEADKLVPKFMRSDLTKAIIKTAKAKTGVGETIVGIVVRYDACKLIIAKGVVNNKLQYKEVPVTYRELGFQSFNDETKQVALAIAVAKTLGSDYEYTGLHGGYDSEYWQVRYKHMDKLEPKLRSAI